MKLEFREFRGHVVASETTAWYMSPKFLLFTRRDYVSPEC